MYPSEEAQAETEDACRECLKRPLPRLNTKRHSTFLLRGLGTLSEGFIAADASRPWYFYWCLNGLAIMPGNKENVARYSRRLRETLKYCQHPDGGFGGGHGQLAHLATTYAAVLAIAVVGDEEGYAMINRKTLKTWIMSLKQANGGFAIHRGGEVDARAAYLALSVAALLDLLTPEMANGTVQWLLSCQRYEGGLSGIHGAEAHAGLSYCALAALNILVTPSELAQLLDADNLLWWLLARQLKTEGGYSGRTNKLVDACYSWWAGAEIPLVEAALGIKESLYDRTAIVRYILCCSQSQNSGGLRDKPGKPADYYHTCYALAGLSAAQTPYYYDDSVRIDQEPGWQSFSWRYRSLKTDLNPVHPIYVIPWDKAEKLRSWSVSEPKPY